MIIHMYMYQIAVGGVQYHSQLGYIWIINEKKNIACYQQHKFLMKTVRTDVKPFYNLFFYCDFFQVFTVTKF